MFRTAQVPTSSNRRGLQVRLRCTILTLSPRKQAHPVCFSFLPYLSSLTLRLEHALQVARASLSRAQKDTQDAFLRYNTCLDTEQQARQAVSTAERRRDDISKCTQVNHHWICAHWTFISVCAHFSQPANHRYAFVTMKGWHQ